MLDKARGLPLNYALSIFIRTYHRFRELGLKYAFLITTRHMDSLENLLDLIGLEIFLKMEPNIILGLKVLNHDFWLLYFLLLISVVEPDANGLNFSSLYYVVKKLVLDVTIS